MSKLNSVDHENLWTVLHEVMDEAPEIKWSGKEIRRLMKKMEKILKRHNA